MFKQMMEFLKEVKLELKKVVFPPRKEVIGSTGVVIVTVLIAAFFLWIADLVVGNLITRALMSR